MKPISDWNRNDRRIAIAADHGGFELKKEITAALTGKGLEVVDYGPAAFDPEDDYNTFGAALARAISKGEIEKGILICRSGIGMAVVANRFHGVRAAVAYSTKLAKASRDHNCSNVLVIPADYLTREDIGEIVNTWLDTEFTCVGGRHARRLNQLEKDSYDDIAAIRGSDPEIAGWIDKEAQRQFEGIELIASENFTSCAVRAAQGSVLTNKYAEGYPAKRYYNGCEFVDEVEKIAIERACRLFGAEAANVQPHSGSQANMAAYFALINPGDTILAMSLDHGGHLTHGHRMNFSGQFYNVIPYGVNKETETIDYDELRRLAEEHKPALIVAGASAYPRTIDFAELRRIADLVGAKLMVDMAHIAGLVAAGLHPSPVPYCDIVTTTTHKTLRGPRGGLILCKEQYLKAVNSKVFPGIQGGPLMHVIAGKAVCFGEALKPEFRAYQEQIVKNAKILADTLVAEGFDLVSGGTDNHLMLVDLRRFGVTGKEMEHRLDEVHITVNKNAIPNDPQSPFITSGIRVGTPAATTRGLKEDDMVTVGRLIKLAAADFENSAGRIRAEVARICEKYPLYGQKQ